MTDPQTPDPRIGRVETDGPVARDPDISDQDRIVRMPNQARQGKPVGSMRYVLGFGILLVVIGFVISYFVGRT
ncbi:hypothetical protein [Prosthecomicrobium sp. N25]|uniref:hypothetical protein n=1 Tax=Prosthecomicrobium sp. N25 TaxID=3129254 RepID=UPI003077F029